jgi:hypothetical protein
MDPVLVTPHSGLLDGHDSLQTESPQIRISADPQKTPIRPQKVPDALLGYRR